MTTVMLLLPVYLSSHIIYLSNIVVIIFIISAVSYESCPHCFPQATITVACFLTCIFSVLCILSVPDWQKRGKCCWGSVSRGFQQRLTSWRTSSSSWRRLSSSCCSSPKRSVIRHCNRSMITIFIQFTCSGISFGVDPTLYKIIIWLI